ncbi:MAG: hypothetical protein DHS20C02_01110 [Micavibrio sp.]|nr:MAG: hypothetical protein DHS20C02_01110 [Micavibrio sp.]
MPSFKETLREYARELFRPLKVYDPKHCETVRHIPNQLKLSFSKGIDTPEKKVKATVWHEGKIYAESIAIFSGVRLTDVKPIAQSLVESGFFKQTEGVAGMPVYEINQEFGP